MYKQFSDVFPNNSSACPLSRLHIINVIVRAFPLFQVIVCSATLHSFDVKKLSERIMHFPTWVDLKGEDSVPETVHHVVVPVNPKSDRLWERLGKNHIRVSLPRWYQKNPTDVFKIKERNSRRLLKKPSL